MTSAILIAAVTLVLASGAECLHTRRVRSVATLAFGPSGKPGIAARFAPWLRVASVSMLAWGLTVLFLQAPVAHRSVQEEVEPADRQHLLVVLDVSPSMRLEDAGQTGKEPRMRRARAVFDSIMARIGHDRLHTTVIAVYNGAKPVVVETRDLEVLHNLMDDLPMHHAFPSGKTKLFDGIQEASAIAKGWPRGSATLVLISDGDTVPSTGMPTLPPAIGGVLVIGVGDPGKGTFINGHNSRQDGTTLRQIATRLGGAYHDANAKFIPTATLTRLGTLDTDAKDRDAGLRELALMLIASGGAILAALPLLLHYFGSSWNPGPRPVTVRRSFPAALNSTQTNV